MATAITAPTYTPAGVSLTAWQHAIHDAYAKATRALPDTNGRLADALTLAQHGAVEHPQQFSEHHYTVASQSDPTGLTVYDVHTRAPVTCTCRDFEEHATSANGYACKHIIAAWIYRRALNNLEQIPDRTPQHTPLPEGESIQVSSALPEAAFSLCLKGRLAGQDAQLTVRGATYQEFAANVAAVRGLLDTPGSTPTTQAPAGSPTPEGWCVVHGVQMKQQSNQRGMWWSHKLPDGSWCKGK